MRRRGIAIAVTVTFAGVAASLVLARPEAAHAPSPDPAPAAASSVAAPVGPGVVLPADRDRLRSIRWLAAASGGTPELNQVSIEQDLALAREVLGEPGYVLFAAGPDAPTVQVLDPELDDDPVTRTLADLFAPRGGRSATYRPPALAVDGPATAERVRTALRHATAGGDVPLVVYIAGHGNIGETPLDNTIGFWAQSSLSVRELGEVLEAAPRPVRVVVTTCYSGGFAELAFERAHEAAGATTRDRCGLFATTWDLEASGCDPNPDRSAQEGYGLHFLNAARGLDRNGEPLDASAIDLDGDGAVSLLEAHTRARIASRAADVPTTTSERWLRHAAPDRGPATDVDLPEERAVVSTLSKMLGLEHDPKQARLALTRLEERIEGEQRRLDQAQAAEDAAYREAAADLLARWPVLDDPWHPLHAPTLQRDRQSIAEHLETSASFRRWTAARDEVARIDEAILEARRRAALYERLVRALDNVALAGRLRARGGAAWETYQRLLACERTKVGPAPR